MAVQAYVLIKCKGGMVEEVLKGVLKKKHITRADAVFGDYDIIAYLEVKELLSTFSVNKLDEIVIKEIGKMKGVVSTNTHIVTTRGEEITGKD
jgi:hypothetical protein